jgi:MoCo/4Fe-4S cofactor protein with predicted Tat translocation signal
MSKRLPHPALENSSAPTWWRSLRERDESPELVEELLREFPPNPDVPDDTISRRSFFRLMGASMAMGGLAACRRPEEKIVPYSKAPEDVIPGNALYFATAMPWGDSAIGLLVESHEGRPTKIEGNPKHPESGGGTNSFAQAAVLELYDPDRLDRALEGGQPRGVDLSEGALAAFTKKYTQSGGRGLAVLTEAHRSPTTQAAIETLRAALPGTQFFRFSPFGGDNARAAAQLVFNRPVDPVYDLSRAKVLVTLDSDLLCDEGSSTRHSRQWAQARSPRDPGQMNRVYAIESRHSVTGAAADHRLRLQSRQIALFAQQLAEGLGLPKPKASTWISPNVAALSTRAAEFIRAIVKDLDQHRGESLVVAGDNQPDFVHACAHLVNVALGNVGKTVRYVDAFDKGEAGSVQLSKLAAAIAQKQVTGLVVLGGNPVFNGPADAKLATRFAEVEDSLYLGHEANETAHACKWTFPRAHFLEQWGDVRAIDGTYSVIQPLIAPLYEGRTDAELLSLLAGKPKKAYDLVRETAGTLFGQEDFERRWRRALHDGLWPASELPAVELGQPTMDHFTAMSVPGLTGAGLEVTFHPDPHTYDGRFANNSWMQELPDPMWKQVWGNVALFSEATMKRLGLVEGDLVNLVGKGAGCEAVVAHGIGQADDSISVTVGQGREHVGRVGKGIGTRTAALRTAAGWGVVDGITIVKRDAVHKVVHTQEHFQMEARAPGKDNFMTRPPVVREADLVAFGKQPDFAKHQGLKQPHRMNIWGEPWKYEGHKWAMTIDLHTCLGCNACAVACQAENNIPVVGPENVAKTREMHWIRIDRYFEGKTDDEVRSMSQPMTCQHCENAPCEQVCPVGATTHSPEGLNDMAYNRCIGTKYCLNNCPFKVRRFNYFNYTKDTPGTKKLQYNPDVTVRSRGVMEKCTYCVQRINAAKIAAHKVGEDRVKDGAIVTACQQVCPTHAISFGDLNDKTSEIARLETDPRGYKLLEEINVRPRGTFLARVKNLNPELV